MDNLGLGSALGDKPFIPSQTLHIFTPAAQISFEDIRHATLQNPNYGTRWEGPTLALQRTPYTKPPQATADHTDLKMQNTPPANLPPHLRRRPATPQAALQSSSRAPSNLYQENPTLETIPQEPLHVLSPPYLKATVPSDLSILSELSLSDAREDLAFGVNVPPRLETNVVQTTPKDLSSKGPANIDASPSLGDAAVSALPPHLRPRKKTTTPQAIKPTNTLDTIGEEKKLPHPTIPAVSKSYQAPKANDLSSTHAQPSTAASPTLPTPAFRLTPALASTTMAHKISPTSNPPSLPSTPPVQPPRQTIASAWSTFAASTSTRPGRSVPSAYTASTITPTRAYGTPVTPRAPTIADPAMEKTLFFQSWPGVEDRGRASKPRTIMITELPENPTLTMISQICKGAGLLESISLIPSTRKAIVWFIEADDAKSFYDKTGNGIVLNYDRGGKKLKKNVFVEMRKEIDVLPSALRTKVDEAGHTRVIRIVGWEKGDLERIPGVKGGKAESEEVLLRRLAEKCAFEGKVERVEGVACCVNALGHLEASLVFSGMKEAYYALGQIRKMVALEACNITFGKDPCEKEVPAATSVGSSV